MPSDIIFSISVPIGSYHPFLDRCLASLVQQSELVEVAVLDASADDRVRAVVDKYSSSISYRHHGPDNGQTDAIMKGWEATGGNFLGWLNADDVLAPDALKHAANAFRQEPSRDVVYGHSLICDDDDFVTGYHWNVMPPGEQILSTCCISQPSCFFKRAALEAVGGLNRDLHYTMDWDLWIRLYNNGASFHLAEQVRSLVLWSKDAKTGGFGYARRSELKSIIDQHAAPKDRWGAYLGYTTQYIYEYLLPRSLRNWIWRRNISGGQGMFGMSVAGEIHDTAHFELFHYEEARKTALELKTQTSPSDFKLLLDSVAVEPEQTNTGVLKVELPKALEPAQTLKIAIENSSDSSVILSGIRLV